MIVFKQDAPAKKTVRALRFSLFCALAAPLFSVFFSQSFAQTNASGKAKAAASCNTCHGVNGMSTLPNAPHLAGQPEIYFIEQMKAYRSGKRSHEIMSLIAKPLNDQDINDLAAWYASIVVTATVKP
jgi:cytochrome c553